MDEITKNAYKALGGTIAATFAIMISSVYVSNKVNTAILDHFLPDLTPLT